MKIYVFKDKVDGNKAFILSKTSQEAHSTLEKMTSIAFELVEIKKLEELNNSVVLYNKILPF